MFSSSLQYLASRNLPLRLSCSFDQPSASGTSFHNWHEPLSKSEPGLRLSASLQYLASRNLPPPSCAVAGAASNSKLPSPKKPATVRTDSAYRTGILEVPAVFASGA